MQPLWICFTVTFNIAVWTLVFVTTCFLLALTVLARFFLVSFRCLFGLSFAASKKDNDVQKEKLCFAAVPLILKKFGIRRQSDMGYISNLAAKTTCISKASHIPHQSCVPPLLIWKKYLCHKPQLSPLWKSKILRKAMKSLKRQETDGCLPNGEGPHD